MLIWNTADLYSTGLILLNHLRLPDSTAKVLAPGAAIQPSVGLIMIAGYCGYYIFLDPVGGVSFLLVLESS